MPRLAALFTRPSPPSTRSWESEIDGGTLMLGLAAGFLLGVMVGAGIADKIARTEAIERGFALYCPDDGAFAWKDECDDTRN